jgi:hypothetical protein
MAWRKMPIFPVWRLSSLAGIPYRHSRPASAGKNASASRADCEGREEGAALVWRQPPVAVFCGKTAAYTRSSAKTLAAALHPLRVPVYSIIKHNLLANRSTLLRF